jgi:hypothetical protein
MIERAVKWSPVSAGENTEPHVGSVNFSGAVEIRLAAG